MAEIYSSSAAGLYVRLARLLCETDCLTEALLGQLADLPTGATIIEIGSGSGDLAREVLGRFSFNYVAIEPSPEMVQHMPAQLVSDTRFTLIQEPFEKYLGEAGSAHAVISRYVIHDYPDDAAAWYGKIRDLLVPGGIFFNLDLALADNPQDTAENMDRIVQIATNLEVNSADEERAKDDLVEHLKHEIKQYMQVSRHLNQLRQVGLEPMLIGREENNYLIKAGKPVSPEVR